MGCVSRPLLLVILISWSLAAAKNTPNCKGNNSEKLQNQENVLMKAIAILGAFLTDLQKPHSRDLPTSVFKLIDDLISEISQIDIIHVLQHFRRLALQQIREARKEMSEVVQNLEDSKAGLFNNKQERNQWVTIYLDNRHLVNTSRLFNIGCHFFDGLISMTSKELYNCCNITMKSSVSLCRSFESLVLSGSDYIADLARLLDQVQFCVENSIANKEYKARCVNLAFNEITKGLNHLMRKLKKLLRIRLLYSKCCISFVHIEVNDRRTNLM